MASAPIPYSDNVENRPPQEDDQIAEVVRNLQSILEQTHKTTGKFNPDVHVKTHGYVPGELHVLPGLPAELAQGLFEQAGTYQTIVRFSNAAGKIQADAIPNGRGMAVKVLGVPGTLLDPDERSGPCQDFVMINHPVFVVANVSDYLRIEKAVADAKGNTGALVKDVLTGGEWNPLKWHWEELGHAAGIASHLPANPVANTYFSMSPYRFGKYVCKYRMKPAGDLHESYLSLLEQLATKKDGLRLALEKVLDEHAVEFLLQVQLRTSERSMPVEDATVEWPESESAFRTVAKLILPKQDIRPHLSDPNYLGLSFNVWHALAEHRPLGGINRMRRKVYPVSAKWRREGLKDR